ncbi:hypothetical protein BgAZ_107810 [Babesia gibsoni]|uniref:6-Cys domain-containing protein n=1 Tax=Babesia gibsoni TaxID=33632 RepID=A0AAD8PGP8_BABGI|nr:hypothetical protein BgAZ_107810 [Babesia gibsoni]
MFNCSMFSVLLAFIGTACAMQWTEFIIEELSNRDNSKRLYVAKGFIENHLSIKIKCPKPFVIYPRNDHAEAAADPHVLVEASGRYVEVPLSKVITSLYFKPLLGLQNDALYNTMLIHYPAIDTPSGPPFMNIMRRHATHIYFLCMLPNTVLQEDVKSKLKFLHTEETNYSRTMKNDLLRLLMNRRQALGMVSVDISHIRNVTHRCSSMDAPEFMTDSYEDVNGVKSCTVDIMEHPDVGFYCLGLVEPSGCFNRLFDSATSEELSLPMSYAKYESLPNQFWYIANYERKNIKKGFSGYCQCVDPSTGLVKAKMTLITGMSHVCNITGMLMDHMTDPIIGNWCDVGLLPGSTLTIMIPTTVYADDHTALTDGPIRQSSDAIISSYLHPQNVGRQFLNPKDVINGFYPQKVYGGIKYLIADALDVNQSMQFDEGIITMIYQENLPLSYPDEFQGLAYIWNLKAHGTTDLKDIAAVINLVPVITNDHSMPVCEPSMSRVFPLRTYNINFHKRVNIRKYMTRICQSNSTTDVEYGLYCPNGFTISGGCQVTGYEDYVDSPIVSLVTSTYSINPMLQNMLIMRSGLSETLKSYSVACSCMDKRGIAAARMVVHKYDVESKSHINFGLEERLSLIVIPGLNIVHKHVDGFGVSEIDEIPLPFSPASTTRIMVAGTMLSSKCFANVDMVNETILNLNGGTEPIVVTLQYSNSDQNKQERGSIKQSVDNEVGYTSAFFFPMNKDKYFYKYDYSDGKLLMVQTEYSSVVGTNSTGFRVYKNEYGDEKYDSGTLYIENPMTAIVVSKTNEASVTLTYICGMVVDPERSKNNVMTSHNDTEVEEEMNVEHETQVTQTNSPSSSNSDPTTSQMETSTDVQFEEDKALSIWGMMDVIVPVTDPYLSGCGATSNEEELFREDTTKIISSSGLQFGCAVNIADEDASFYCPPPYITEPEDCIPSTSNSIFTVKKPGRDGNKHLYVFTKRNAYTVLLRGFNGRNTLKFECRCITTKGYLISKIQIYA